MNTSGGTRPVKQRRIGWIVVVSILGGFVLALLAVVFVVPGSVEHVVTGSAMVAFGLGWAALVVLSSRFTGQPQRWAAVPAAYLISVGVALLVFSPSYFALDILGFIWPPVVLAMAVWMIRQARQHLQSPTRKWLVLPVCVILMLFSVGGGFAAVGGALASDDRPVSGQFVDVGGYEMYLECSGVGSPAVVLEAGLFGSSADWDRVTAAVGAETQVCAYDRAGRGHSEAAPDSRDGLAVAADLHALLHGAGIEGPYVMVGHSTGGVYVRIFASAYPNEVAGLVLLDAQPVEAFTGLPTYPGFYRWAKVGLGVLPSLARSGVMQVAVARSIRDEFIQLPIVLDQGAASTGLGDRPLMVVTAGENDMKGWMPLQDAMASLSTNSVHVVLDATHTSLLDDDGDAAAASEAILEVVGSVRSGIPFGNP